MAMSKHFAVISLAFAEDAVAALVVDGAGSHRPSGRSQIPPNIVVTSLLP